MNKPIVWVPNKAGHDFSDAERFGTLRFLTEGTVKRYHTNSMYRGFANEMQQASSHDYLLVSSLTILNAIASSILAYRFGRVNYLLYRHGEYLERSVDFGTLLDRANDT